MRDYCRVTAADAGFDLAEFERRLLQSALDDSPEGLREPLTQLLAAGGKRVRPQLVYRFGHMLRGPQSTLDDVAIAIEMLHTATLVHDDVIDQAETRRGRPALHREHGREVADVHRRHPDAHDSPSTNARITSSYEASANNANANT